MRSKWNLRIIQQSNGLQYKVSFVINSGVLTKQEMLQIFNTSMSDIVSVAFLHEKN